jgi:hypothetical protein
VKNLSNSRGKESIGIITVNDPSDSTGKESIGICLAFDPSGGLIGS